MKRVAQQVIGIVGGMGPSAGHALFGSLVKNTVAARDQEHPSVVLMSFPGHIADRTAFLEGAEATNPALAIAEVLGRLERAGATVAGIACNTSHAPRIFTVIEAELAKRGSDLALLHMPRETIRHIRERHPGLRRVGVLGTNGTYRSGVYKQILSAAGLEAVLLPPAFQDEVIHRMIYDPLFGIKASSVIIRPEVHVLMDTALDFFERAGAEALVLGCTELSLLVDAPSLRGMRIIDSTEALALALLRETAIAEKAPMYQ